MHRRFIILIYVSGIPTVVSALHNRVVHKFVVNRILPVLIEPVHYALPKVGSLALLRLRMFWLECSHVQYPAPQRRSGMQYIYQISSVPLEEQFDRNLVRYRVWTHHPKSVLSAEFKRPSWRSHCFLVCNIDDRVVRFQRCVARLERSKCSPGTVQQTFKREQRH